jgi:hypothetical protein
MALVHQMSDQQLMMLMSQHDAPPAIQMAGMQEMQSRQKLRGGMPQQGQQGPGVPPQQQGPAMAAAGHPVMGAPPPGGGVASLPAQNMQHMAQGGMVAFAGDTDGSFVPYGMGGGGGAQNSYSYSGIPAGAIPPNLAVQQGGNSQAAAWGHALLSGAEGVPLFGPLVRGAHAAISAAPSWEEVKQYPAAITRRLTSDYALAQAPSVQDAHDARIARPNATANALAATPSPGAAPAQGGQQQPQQPQDDISDISRSGMFGKLFPDRYPETDPTVATLSKQEAAMEAAKRANQGLAWLHAGAAMLQNTTPFAAVALGKGVDAYATSKEAAQAAEQAGLAHIAQQQGEQYKTQMGYAGSVDTAMAHSYGQIRYGLILKAQAMDAQSRDTLLKADAQVNAQLDQHYLPMENWYRQQGDTASLAAIEKEKAIVYQQRIEGLVARANGANRFGFGPTQGSTTQAVPPPANPNARVILSQ